MFNDFLLEIYKYEQAQSYKKKEIDEFKSCEKIFDVLWLSRPKIQIIYTSDFLAIPIKECYHEHVKNYVFCMYLNLSGRISPYPNLFTGDSIMFNHIYLKCLKTICSGKEKFFSLNNIVDGPLKNVVSVRCIESIADPRVDDIVYDNHMCTPIRTILNCMPLCDMQATHNYISF